MDNLKTVINRIDEKFPEQLQFLTELIRCKSVLCDPEKGEKKAQLLVYRKLKEMGLAVDMFEPDLSKICKHPGFSAVEWSYCGRPQVAGVYKSADGTGKSLTFVGHVDVVPAGVDKGWSYDPWNAKISGDRLYGRGAGDMKGGVSAMVYALYALIECGVTLKGNVTLLSVLEEECGGNGALACLERGYVGDACISPEPMPYIAIGSPGVLWIRMKVFGTPGHVQIGYECAGAFENALKLINSLRKLEEKLNRQENRHPAFQGHPHPFNFNVGKVNGGEWTSSVMDEITVEMRVAWNPFVPLPEGKKIFADWLDETIRNDSALRSNPPEITFPAMHFDGVVVDEKDPLIQALQAAHSDICGRPADMDIMTGSADSRFWPLYYGKPGIVFGPAGGNLHAYDEYVEIESLRETTKVLARCMMGWCGVG